MGDRWLSWRDRMLGSPAARRRLERLPLGRRIAASHADRLFALVAGFAHSQMLAAAIDLGLFDRLAEAPVVEADLPALLGLPEPGARALIQALVALDLIERRSGGRLGLAVDGLVVTSDPGLRAMIAHHRLLYADLTDPAALLRAPGSGRVGAFWPYAGAAPPEGFSALMAASQSFIIGALLDSYRFGRHHRLLDVGGGDGSFVAALAARWPGLDLGLVDLPSVAALARARLAAAGLGRIAVHERPDEASPIPPGADAITLVRVLHDRDDAAALALLRACADSLAPRGRLIVAEPMARRGRDPQAAYFAAYFAAMGQGRLRSPATIRALLREAGLRPVARLRTPSPLLALLTAQRA